MPRVFIPPPLRPLTGSQEVVEAAGATVLQAIEDLDRRYPGLKERLCDGPSLRRGMVVVVGGSTSALGLLQRVAADDEIHFLPVVGGG
jgi:molybdopterin synthase sulfur carrier subunit